MQRETKAEFGMTYVVLTRADRSRMAAIYDGVQCNREPDCDDDGHGEAIREIANWLGCDYRTAEDTVSNYGV